MNSQYLRFKGVSVDMTLKLLGSMKPNWTRYQKSLRSCIINRDELTAEDVSRQLSVGIHAGCSCIIGMDQSIEILLPVDMGTDQSVIVEIAKNLDVTLGYNIDGCFSKHIGKLAAMACWKYGLAGQNVFFNDEMMPWKYVNALCANQLAFKATMRSELPEPSLN
jgi:hypothetical protein